MFEFKLNKKGNIINQLIQTMQTHQICQLLQNSLNPSLTVQTTQILLKQIQKPKFITSLLIIADNTQYKISLRQSALIYVKNALIDDYKQRIRIPDDDFQTVKSSVLQALIRNCQQRSLTPMLRQIIYLLAQKEYPHNWTDVIPQISNNIQNSGDFNQIFGSIQALKAFVSVFGKSINQKVTLQNLANKVVLPLLSIALKLFQNYNQTTSVILISIFKIFSTLTFFYIPQVIILNMHAWMIFVKKLLDLSIQSGNIDINMYQLKKICLRIMFRLYQRHLNRKYSLCDVKVIDDFHQRFTRGIVQSLLLQIMNQTQLAKTSTNKNYTQLTKFSLACLSYIYEEDRNAAILIDNYRDKIIFMCLERYGININKGYSSYTEFAGKLKQQRVHFCSFIQALIRNQTRVVEQRNKGNYQFTNMQQLGSILGSLFTHIEKGSNQLKQLSLYIFSDIAEVLPEVDNQIQSKMVVFITNIVKPILKSNDTPVLIKLRCCQIISKYSYIQFPQNQLQNIAAGVQECLISNNNQSQNSDLNTFLQINAVYAFNSLLRYDYIVNFTAPFLSQILRVYTSLLEIETSLIKCLQDLLAKFQSHLQPYGNNLIQLLTNMYFRYNQLVLKTRSGQIKQRQNNFNKIYQNQQDNDDSEGQQQNQSIEHNYLNASKACLGTIRQIIQAPTFQLQNQQLIHNLLFSIFSQKESLHTQQGFNILNQILFKVKTISADYNIYFSLIILGILPINQEIVNKYKQQNSIYSDRLLKMLQSLCAVPDEDFIENTVGCLRNFISKYQKDLRNIIDKCGMSFLQLLLTTVKYVHQNQSNKATQTDRSIILTLYISLIEWNALNENQLRQILQNIGNWLNMQKQACQQITMSNSKSKNSNQFGKQQLKKTVYGPIYIQIVLLSIHFYPKITLQIFHGNWISNQLLQNWQRLHCDYSLSRLLIGVADLLNYQSINDQFVSTQIMNKLPDAIERACKLRLDENIDDLKSEDDQAEQDKFFGMDENTHFMGWKNKPLAQQNNNNQNNQDQMEDEEQQDQQQWDEQFNKYYLSPLDGIDQIAYVYQILKKNTSQTYMGLIRTDLQEKLSYLILNAPSKFHQNQNN